MLGLGAARLPLDDTGVEIVRRAIEGGVSYLDLGLPYDLADHERRCRLAGRALGNGYRARTMVAAGLPALLVESLHDLDVYLDGVTDRLGGAPDFFLAGGLDRYTWPRLASLGLPEWMEKAVAGGRFARPGFAFHDTFQYLKEIVEAYDGWGLVRLQYSYMDIDHHPGTSGIDYAASRGLGVIVAEPLKGGRLTRRPPESVAKVIEAAPRRLTPAAWGLRWAWDHSGVSTVVVDVSSMAELEECLALADAAGAGGITVGEEVYLGRVRDAYRKLRAVPCTACRGCMPCPRGIDAPRIFELYNDALMYGDVETMRTLYKKERHRIEDCDECGACLICGFKIDIPGFLHRAKALMDEPE